MESKRVPEPAAGGDASETSFRSGHTETLHDFSGSLQPGSVLGTRYKIKKLLGAGGMGRVYQAEDLDLGIDVAIKIIRPELLQQERALERFKNELLLARKVSHKNVVRIHDIGEIEGLKYLSMSFIPGQSLRDVLSHQQPLPLDRLIAIFQQICEGVVAAHEENVIHRDLKPANIMLDEHDRVYITDFGIARSIDSDDATQSGMLIGTPAYFSPEQLFGQTADSQSDVYALGLILCEMLLGELPYNRDTSQTFRTKGPAGLEQRIRQSRLDTPPYLAAIAKKCLDPERHFRYKDARAVLDDLQRRQVRSRPVRLQPAIAIAIALLLLAGLFAYFRLRPNEQAVQTQTTTPAATIQEVRSIAVLPFINKTGKAEMDWIESAIGGLLVADLSQAAGLRVLSADRVHQTLQDLRIPAGSYNQTTTDKLSLLLDTDLLIHGSLTQSGTQIRADAQVIDRRNPSQPIYFKSTGAKQEDLFMMVEGLAHQIQSHALETEPPRQTKRAEISLKALKSYNEGIESWRKGGPALAIQHLNSAIEESPQFSRAYLKLSEFLDQTGETEKAVESLEKALQSSKELDPKSSYLIRSQKALLSGELDRAIELYQEMGKQYPNDSDVLYELAVAYEEKGDLKNAIAALDRVVERDSNHPEAYFHLGKDTILIGDPEKAISRYLIKALSVYTQLNNPYGEADALNAMGVAYERLGRYPEAIKYYNQSIALKEKIGNQKGVATSRTNIAKIQIFQGQYAEAEKEIAKTQKIFEATGDRAGVAGAFNMLGVIREDQGKYEEALNFYKKALQLRKELGNDQLTAQSYDNIGQIYYLTGQYDNAQVYWLQSLSLRKSIGEESGVILSLQNMGFLQTAQGELNEALKSFMEALNRSRETKFENAIAVSLGNLGNIYQHQGRYGAAIDSYQKAIDVLKGLNDKKGVAEYTKLLGSVFVDLQNEVAAESSLNNAMTMAQEIRSQEIIADVYLLLGRLYRTNGKLTEAGAQIDAAINEAQKIRYQRALMQAKIEQGLLLAASAKPKEANALLQKALSQANEENLVWPLLESYYALAFIHAETNPRLALDYAKRGLASAEKIGAIPYLYRLHAISGRSYLQLREAKQAGVHFQKGAALLEEMSKEMDKEHFSTLLHAKESQQIYDGLKALQQDKPRT